jgi:hypothetical protein
MAGRTASLKQNQRKFRVGDRVIRVVGERRFPAEIVEDRGFIGRGGRQLLRIRRTGVPVELAEPYEVPAEELERPK